MTRRDWLAAGVVAALALGATVTSIGHDFTFDDRYVVLANGHVHQLRNLLTLFGQTYWPIELGGDGYRPVVMSLFTLQWVAGSGAPWVFHLTNIILAVATALAVQWCAAAILPAAAAWAAAALYAVHPVHVEVTGNVVGQSELIVALCLSLAMGIYLRARRRGWLRPRDAAGVLALYAIGLFAKEHAIVLPGLLLAAEVTVIHDSGWRSRVAAMRKFALLVVAVSVAYLFVRSLVQKDLAGFVPFPVFRFLRMSAFDRVATMMTEMPRVARLLVFPSHLSGDYSPTEVAVQRGFDLAQLPGIFLIFGCVLLAVALRKRAPVVSFGLSWVMVAFLPVSNLLVPAGFVTAERTLFFPSVGVVLIAGAIVERLMRDERIALRGAALAGVAVLIALGLAKSIDRQRVWKNNDIFFDQLVKDEPNGYRAHFLRGRHIGSHYRLRETEQEYKRAIRLFPYDVPMMLAISSDYYRAGMCGPTTALLTWTYAVEPLLSEGRYQYVECLGRLGRWEESRAAALDALRVASIGEGRRIRGAFVVADSALGRRRRKGRAGQVARVSQTARDTAISRSAGPAPAAADARN
ncbi:MAG: tetratricopeptide repeat protein [Gemmatimonadaceae bacterium]